MAFEREAEKFKYASVHHSPPLAELIFPLERTSEKAPVAGSFLLYLRWFTLPVISGKPALQLKFYKEIST